MSWLNCKSLKKMKTLILCKDIDFYWTFIISQCEKYLIFDTHHSNIKIYSLQDVCRKTISINLKFFSRGFVFGVKHLYILSELANSIHYTNIICFLKKKNRRWTREKRVNVRRNRTGDLRYQNGFRPGYRYGFGYRRGFDYDQK